MEISQPGGKYHLYPDQQIEIEDFNPMLTPYGSRSQPIALPPTPHNLNLIGNPQRLGRREKYVNRFKFTISEGVFRKTGTHYVFSVDREGIQTSFYFKEGEFNANMKNIKLPDINWGSPIDLKPEGSLREKITAWFDKFTAVMTGAQQADYCVFPVITKYDEKKEEGKETTHTIELINQLDRNGKLISDNPNQEFFNKIPVPYGYGATCFLRLAVVLDRVFAHFGLKLKPTIWHSDADFSRLVVLNNTADTIIDGVLNYADLVPSIKVDEF